MLFFTLLTACSKDQPETCTTTVSTTLQECIADYTERLSECMTENDELCTDSDSQLTEILRTASQTTTMACEGNSPYAAITDEFLGERIAEAWTRHSESCFEVLGPHSAVWKDSEPSEQSCLSEIHGFEQDYINVSADHQ